MSHLINLRFAIDEVAKAARAQANEENSKKRKEVEHQLSLLGGNASAPKLKAAKKKAAPKAK